MIWIRVEPSAGYTIDLALTVLHTLGFFKKKNRLNWDLNFSVRERERESRVVHQSASGSPTRARQANHVRMGWADGGLCDCACVGGGQY